MLDGFPGVSFYSDQDLDCIINAVGGFPSGLVRHYGLLHFKRVHQITDDYGSREVNIEPIPVSRRRELHYQLENAVRGYLTHKAAYDFPTVLQLHTRYKAIVSACEALTNAIKELDDDIYVRIVGDDNKYTMEPDLPKVILVGPVEECGSECPNKPDLQHLMTALKQVQEWAYWNREASTPRKRFEHGGARKSNAPTPLDTYLRYLGATYTHVFEKKTKFSIHLKTGEVCGPFSRYLDACLRPILLEDTPTPDTLRSHYRRLSA